MKKHTIRGNYPSGCESRIAIAEACGWSHQTTNGHTYWWHEQQNETLPADDDGMRACPDYLTDLNAMHEAEKVLNQDHLIRYWEELEEIVGCLDYCDGNEMRKAICATASQRAEAFLRCLNL